MKAVRSCIRLGLVIALWGSALPAFGQQTRRVTNGFEVEIEHRLMIGTNSALIEIENYSGDVELVGSDDREIIITEIVLIEAESVDEARTLSQRYFSDVIQEAERIRIRGAVRHGDGRRLHARLAGGMTARVSSINGDITVTGTDGSVDLATGAGDVTVEYVQASVDVVTGAGEIRILNVDGPVSGVSGAGDVVLEIVRDDVDVATGAGDLEMSNVRGRLELTSGGGDIDVHDSAGNVMATTAGGDIDLERIDGHADLSTPGGSIDVRGLTGNLTATTLGGDILGSSIKGSIAVGSMAGDLDFSDVQGEIVAATEVGDITVVVENDLFLRTGKIDLRAENGDVDLRLPGSTGADLLIELTVIQPCDLTEAEYGRIRQDQYPERDGIRPWADRSCLSYTIR